jgi:hypothetical protein
VDVALSASPPEFLAAADLLGASEVDSAWQREPQPQQLSPEGESFVWLIMAGRGWGKTRTGAEWLARQAQTKPGDYAVIARSSQDCRVTGGQRNDVTQLLPLIDGVGPVTGKPGRPRKRAERVLADRGYDHDKYRRELRKRGVKPVIARRGSEHGSGLGKNAGSWSAPSPGCTTCAGCGSATSAIPSCTWRSCCSAVRWSASAS